MPKKLRYDKSILYERLRRNYIRLSPETLFKIHKVMREEHIGIYAIIDIMFKKLQCHMCHIPIDSPECIEAQELKGYPRCINKYYDFKLKTKGRLKNNE